MDNKTYRSSNDLMEILGIIQRSTDVQQNILWQNRPAGRLVINVSKIDCSLVQKRITVKMLPNGELLDPTADVFFKLSYRDTIFKAKVLEINGSTLILQLPKEVKTQELRAHPRVKVPAGEDFGVYLRPAVQLTSGNKSPQIKVKLIDVSTLGLGLAVSENNKHLFGESEIFWVDQVEEIPIDPPIKARIVFSRPIKQKIGSRSPKQSHVGFMLSTHFSGEVYKEILSQLRGKNLDFEGLFAANGLDQSLRESIESERRRVLDELKGNLHLRDFYYSLEGVIEANSYLHQHIRMLILASVTISNALARDLGLDLRSLIFAAYLHDGPLFLKPRLAGIKNLSDFHLKRSQLSDDHQKLFLEAPVLARNLGQQVRNVPAVLETILHQQKELPDYEGFPNHLNSSRIHPYAVVFIVAHDLVDFILDNPSWTLHDYLISAEEKFRGGYFPIVLDALGAFRQK